MTNARVYRHRVAHTAGLCVVLFHRRWARRICAHRRLHDVSLHGSTVRGRREERRKRGDQHRRGRSSASFAVGLLGISFLLFFYTFLFIYFYSLQRGVCPFTPSHVDRPSWRVSFSLYSFPAFPASPRDPPSLLCSRTVSPEMFSSLPLPLFPPRSIRAVRRITQHFLDHRKTVIQLVDTMRSIIVTRVVSQSHKRLLQNHIRDGESTQDDLKKKN